MNQVKDFQVKCSNKKHDCIVQLACFNEFCQENRIYCLKCLSLEDHAAHLKDQHELLDLFQFAEQIRLSSIELINKLSTNIEKINQSFQILSQGLKSKYQLSSQQIERFNAKQLNQALGQMLKYDQISKGILSDVEKCSNDTFIQVKRIVTELKLDEIIYYEPNDRQIEQAKEFYLKGYQLFEDEKYNEAIEQLDLALLINPNHQLAIKFKAYSLRKLQKYNDSIIWINKALKIDSNHIYSLYVKGFCLQNLLEYSEAIFYYNKVIQQDPNFFDVIELQTLCEKKLRQT